jgi:hypothetical protein
MSALHTPGPWLYDESTGFVRDASGFAVADAYEAFEKTQSNINGRLIAAAPDLLEAARKVLPHLNARIDAASAAGQPVPLFDGIADLHAAISKATGSAT